MTPDRKEDWLVEIIIKVFMDDCEATFQPDRIADAIRTELNRRLDGLKKEKYTPTDEQVGNGAYYHLREIEGFNSAIEKVKEQLYDSF